MVYIDFKHFQSVNLQQIVVNTLMSALDICQNTSLFNSFHSIDWLTFCYATQICPAWYLFLILIAFMNEAHL